MNVKIITEASGELVFNMTENDAIRLIGAAMKYDVANNDDEIAAQKVVRQPEVSKKKTASRVETMFGDYKSRIPIPSVIPKMPAVRSPKPEQEESYRGFLLIRCEECGKLRGFYVNKPQTQYYCKCGHVTPLVGLRPLYLNCKECGDSIKYMTNEKRDSLTYDCLTCDNPTDLEINQRGTAYITVGNSRKT